MNNQPQLPENCRPTQMLYKISFVPMPTPLFVLRFVFSIITEAEEQQKCGRYGKTCHMMYTQGGHVGGGGAQLQIRVQ